MTTRTFERLISGSAVLGIGQLFSQCLAFLRTLFLARCLVPEEFGVAATLTLVVTFIDLVSDLHGNVLTVQAPDGDSELFQGTVQSFQIIRGLLAGAIMIVLAAPASALFDSPTTATGLLLLGIVQPIRGLFHVDRIRFQRRLHYWPFVLSEAAGQLAAIVALLVCIALFHDYRAMVYSQIAQNAVTLIASHSAAERPFRLRWDPLIAGRVLKFGAPLMAGGIVTFATMQGDRFLVASSGRLLSRSFTLGNLATYSVAVSLTTLPVLAIVRVVYPIALPLMSEMQALPHKFRDRYTKVIQFVCLVAGALSVGFILGGKPLVEVLYGSHYEAAGTLVQWLGVGQALFLIRSLVGTAALAVGNSKITLYSNSIRGIGLMAMVLAVVCGGGLLSIVQMVALFELCALLIAALMLRSRESVPLTILTSPLLIAAALVTLLCTATKGLPPMSAMQSTVIGGAGAIVAAACLVLALPQLRAQFVTILRNSSRTKSTL